MEKKYFFTVNELSEKLKISKLYIYNLILSENIQIIKIDKILIPILELKKMPTLENMWANGGGNV
ncbi:hypothetical protein ACER0A_002340 [Haloimpatiens sp. FM7315]|uniref:hypothetical protein n=1 Tax=Haloimpatiens sp. FM7315 TaxID=3298609 RepID=UPI00370A07F8